MFHDGVSRLPGAVLTPAVALMSLAFAGPASATLTVHKLIGELDLYTPPGQSQTTLEGVGDVTTNANGAYVVRARTFPPFDNTGYGLLYGRPDALTSDAILHEEIPLTIGPTTYYREGFGPVATFNNLGQLGYAVDIAFSDAFGSPQYDSLWIDNSPMLIEGDAIAGIPGMNFEGFALVGLTDAGTLYYKGSYDGNKSGYFSGAGTPILKVGDVIGGSGDTVLNNDIGSFGNVSMSPDGQHYMTELDINPAVWTPSTPFGVVTDLLVLNGNAATFASNSNTFLKQGQLIPAADGGLGDHWDGSFGRYAVNNSGLWGTTGTTDAATNDAVIVVGGTIVAREGDSIPTADGGSTTLAGSPKNIDINEQGDIAYIFGESIVVNGVEYLTPGAPIDNGETLSKIQSSLAITDRDVNDMITVFFTGRGLVNSGSIADTAYSIVIDLSLAGDLNGDGFVGLDDLDIILNSWNQTVPPGNPLADPSGDSYVGLDDLDIVLNNWNAGTPPGVSIVIPEPASSALIILGMSALLRRHSSSRTV